MARWALHFKNAGGDGWTMSSYAKEGMVRRPIPPRAQVEQMVREKLHGVSPLEVAIRLVDED